MATADRILAVDDNEMNLFIVEEVLGEEFDLVTAASGEEALASAEEQRPDLILLDIMMPGIDGYETCRRIRANPALENIKIILVSAKAMVSERLQGYEAGADDYITKPFEPEELLAKVQVFLRLKRAEELDDLKTDVLKLISHEIRTPLVGIQAAFDILRDEPELSEEDRRSWVDTGMDSCQKLERLVDKSLLLCQLRAEQAEFQIESFDVGPFLESLSAKARAEATLHEVTIRVQDAGSGQCAADVKRLDWALEAILANAIQHSPDHGTVELTYDDTETAHVFRIRDQGAGLDSSRVTELFAEFGAHDVTHHSEGHGLSLAISQEIVNQHGGSIEVDSTPGEGTEISIQLPKSLEPDPVPVTA